MIAWLLALGIAFGVLLVVILIIIVNAMLIRKFGMEAWSMILLGTILIVLVTLLAHTALVANGM